MGVGVGGSGVTVTVGDPVGSAGIAVKTSSATRSQPITNTAAVTTPMATSRPKCRGLRSRCHSALMT